MENSEAPSQSGTGTLFNVQVESNYKGGNGCSVSNPCGAGEGDCDKDSECQGQLICY